MNRNRTKRVDQLNGLRTNAYKHLEDINEAIELYGDSAIPNYRTAQRIIANLTSGRKSVNERGLKALEAYRTEKEYFVSGTAKILTSYSKHRRGAVTHYNKRYESTVKERERVMASSAAKAKRKFEILVKSKHLGGNGVDSDQWKNEEVEDIFIDDVVEAKSFRPRSEAESLLKSASPVQYDFIPSDESLLGDKEGYCVVDQIDKLYGHLNSRLARHNFIASCYAYERDNQVEREILLGRSVPPWEISQGVRAQTLNWILKANDISFHSFDIMSKCFDKYISKHRNYPSLVYYAVNNHMYYVGDHSAAMSLIQSSRDFETKINSEMVLKFEGLSRYVDEHRKVKTIFENVPVPELCDDKYKNSIVFYTELDHLEDVLIDIIRHHNYIPTKIKHQGASIVRIVFEKGGHCTILSLDANNSAHKELSYKDIIKLCEAHQIEFKNQNIGTLVSEIRAAFFFKGHKRIKFTKQQRLQLFERDKETCKVCCKEIPLKNANIDHIKPLSAGGSNELDNLQILCKDCHFEKTHLELLNNEFVRVSKTASSYNSITFDIITSSSSGVFPFIETLVPQTPKNAKLFVVDLIKSRKNAIYHSRYNFPLFTVMDSPVRFTDGMSYRKTGIYFVQSDLYFPIRGNGWYSHAMVTFLMERKLIKEWQIQYALYSSLETPRKYFNDFIDATYAMNDGYEKFKINCMIGLFKPSKTTHYRTIAISTDPNVIYYHYLKSKASFIDNFDVDGKIFYHLMETYDTKTEESETPIYNMTLEMENINLYEMCEEIRRLGGTVLDVNTDGAVCVFPDDRVPFRTRDGVIKGYYYDKEQQVPKYRLESNAQRVKIGHLPRWKRDCNYALKEREWTTVLDVPDNNFMPLVDQMLGSGKGFSIDGRAGTGKSFFIKTLHSEMNNRGLKYIAMAPTNIAARIIKGRTIHKFIAAFSCKRFTEKGYSYIFVDEISMVQEVFYKFFVYLKRLMPELKFIIAGDFEQLLPIKDRLEQCNYKNSVALLELCDGQRLTLTKCRRSDQELFDLLAPENIGSIEKWQFSSQLAERHLTKTNYKRIELNEMMMRLVLRQKRKKALILPKLAYDKNSQEVRLIPSMPVISRRNNKSLDIVNNEHFVIKQIDLEKSVITLKNGERIIEIPVDQFQRFFYVAYAMTVCKSQGSTFQHSYTIHEWERYTNRLKYVSLSRASSRELINVV